MSLRQSHIARQRSTYGEAWKLIRSRADLTSSARLVLLAIAWFSESDICSASIQTLARITGVSRSSLVRSISELEATSCIVVVRQGGGRTTNSYRVLTETVPFLHRTPYIKRLRGIVGAA